MPLELFGHLHRLALGPDLALELLHSSRRSVLAVADLHQSLVDDWAVGDACWWRVVGNWVKMGDDG